MKKLKEILQKILSLKLVRQTRRKITRITSSVISSSYLISVPYHWFAFLNFMREQRAVAGGKRGYFSNLGKQRSSRVELRRNIHRIEKGLIMKNRRAIFAENYIVETVNVFAEAALQYKTKTVSVDEGELVWAQNVLDEYFKVTTPVGSVKKAKQIFDTVDYKPKQTDKRPFIRPVRESLPTYKQMLSLSMYRRSVRWFIDRPVDRKLIDKALLVAKQSPSACNRLPYEFRIFDDPKLVKKVATTPFGTAGYAENIPVVAVLVGSLDSYFSARDRHGVYVDTALAAMSFAFALETLGLSSCMIHWPDFEPLERKMQKLLKLDISERPIMLMAIGYADPKGLIAFSEKKNLENIRSYNFET